MTSFEFYFYPSLFFILGACFGSFGNVLIYRLPQKLSVIKPGSFCYKCKSPISFYDNIPIFSYFILSGKCRKCSAPYSIRYSIIELLSALIFLALYFKLGLCWTLVEYMILSWGMLIASVIDLDHRILPDVMTLTGIVVGLLGALLNPERSFMDSLFGFLAGGGFLWAVAYIYSAIKKEEGMGGGDIKLLAWIGAVLGWKAVIFTILVSSIVGSIVGLIAAARQKSGLKTAIPFGPFLSFAAFIYIFIGQPAIRAYLSIFFPFGDA